VRRLIIRPGAIGDCILSLPAIEALRTDYTEVWVARQNVSLIRFADRVRAIADTGLDWLEIDPASPPPKLIESLRNFDSIVSWYGWGREAFHAAVERWKLPAVVLPALPRGPGKHATDFYLDQVRGLGARDVPPIPRVPCQPAPAPDVVIHPFASSEAKRWPLDSFRELASRLEARWRVGWVAGPEETLPEAHRFDDLYELARWLAGTHLFVGNDSGIAHLAAAVGTAVVAVFGPTDDRVWGPRGPRAEIVRPAARPAPVSEVPVEGVWDAVCRLLERTAGQRPPT